MNNWENAFPILHEFGFPATIFVISRLWGIQMNGCKKMASKRLKLLGWSELKKMVENGITIGAHTRTHPLLTEIDADSATEEIRGPNMIWKIGLECQSIFLHILTVK